MTASPCCTRDGGPVAPNRRRRCEFVCDPLPVAGFERRRRRVGKRLALAPREQVVRLFDPFPSLVPVHGVVAPCDRCNPPRPDFLRLFLEIAHIPEAAVRIGVPPVRKSMDAHPVAGQSLPCGQAQQGVQMMQGRMHAPVRKQPHEMQSGPPFDSMARCSQQGLVLEKIAVLDGLVDARNFLVDYASRPKIHMAHFGVSHLAVR